MSELNQVGIDLELTEEERRFLFDHRNSEHFRVFAKAIACRYAQEAGRLVSVPMAELPRSQGVLQGLLAARGMIVAQSLGGAPQSEKPTNSHLRTINS